MNNIQKINIDIMNNKTADYIYSKQYDRNRQVQFTITEDGEAIDISELYCLFSMKYGDYVAYEILDKVDDAYFKLDMAAKHTVVSGKVPYQLTITKSELTKQQDGTWYWDGQDTIVGTVTGYMIIEPNVVDEDDIETDSESLLEEILTSLARAGEYMTEAKNMKESLDACSQIIVSSTEPSVSKLDNNDYWVLPYE